MKWGLSLYRCHCWRFVTRLLHNNNSSTPSEFIPSDSLARFWTPQCCMNMYKEQLNIMHHHIIRKQVQSHQFLWCEKNPKWSIIGLTQCLAANGACWKIKRKRRRKSRALQTLHHPLARSPISIHPSTCPAIRPHNFKESPFPGNPVAGRCVSDVNITVLWFYGQHLKVGPGRGKTVSRTWKNTEFTPLLYS